MINHPRAHNLCETTREDSVSKHPCLSAQAHVARKKIMANSLRLNLALVMKYLQAAIIVAVKTPRLHLIHHPIHYVIHHLRKRNPKERNPRRRREGVRDRSDTKRREVTGRVLEGKTRWWEQFFDEIAEWGRDSSLGRFPCEMHFLLRGFGRLCSSGRD
jgi:hypothetical protein